MACPSGPKQTQAPLSARVVWSTPTPGSAASLPAGPNSAAIGGHAAHGRASMLHNAHHQAPVLVPTGHGSPMGYDPQFHRQAQNQQSHQSQQSQQSQQSHQCQQSQQAPLARHPMYSPQPPTPLMTIAQQPQQRFATHVVGPLLGSSGQNQGLRPQSATTPPRGGANPRPSPSPSPSPSPVKVVNHPLSIRSASPRVIQHVHQPSVAQRPDGEGMVVRHHESLDRETTRHRAASTSRVFVGIDSPVPTVCHERCSASRPKIERPPQGLEDEDRVSASHPTIGRLAQGLEGEDRCSASHPTIARFSQGFEGEDRGSASHLTVARFSQGAEGEDRGSVSHPSIARLSQGTDGEGITSASHKLMERPSYAFMGEDRTSSSHPQIEKPPLRNEGEDRCSASHSTIGKRSQALEDEKKVSASHTVMERTSLGIDGDDAILVSHAMVGRPSQAFESEDKVSILDCGQTYVSTLGEGDQFHAAHVAERSSSTDVITPSPEELPPWRSLSFNASAPPSTVTDDSSTVEAISAIHANDVVSEKEKAMVLDGEGMKIQDQLFVNNDIFRDLIGDAADDEGAEATTTEDMGWTPSFHSLAPLEDDDRNSIPRFSQSSLEPEAFATSTVVSPESVGTEGEKVSIDGQGAVRSIDVSRREEISKAEEQIAELKSAISAKVAERRCMEAQNSKTLSRITESKMTVTNLQSELEETKSQRDSMRKQLKDKSEKHEDLTRKLKAQQDANRELENDVANASATKQELEVKLKQEQMLRSQAERLAKELQQKVKQLGDDVAAVAAARTGSTPDYPANLEIQLDRLRGQLEETVKAVQTRRNDAQAAVPVANGARAISPTSGVKRGKSKSPARRRRPGTSSPLSSRPKQGDGTATESGTNAIPSTPQFFEQTPKVQSCGSSGAAATAEDDDATATEEELPTAEEQLLGEWSSTSLYEPDQSPSIGDSRPSSSPTSVCMEVERRQSSGATPMRRLPSPHSSPPHRLVSVELGDGVDDPLETPPSTTDSSRVSSTLSMRDLSEIKALKKPPPPIRMLMEVCCILFHIEPVKQPNDRCTKLWRADYWEPARRYLLSDPFFLSKLRLYDDEIAPAQRAKIRRYFQDPEFTADRVKQCSKAAHELYRWVQLLMQRQLVPQPPKEDRDVGTSPIRATRSLPS